MWVVLGREFSAVIFCSWVYFKEDDSQRAFVDNIFCSRVFIFFLQGNLGFVYNDFLIKWFYVVFWMEMNIWVFERCLMFFLEVFEFYFLFK